MVDLKTNYMGLTLKNPVIVGSSGLTNSVEKIKKLADNGAGAVVLKSLFEEQIMYESAEIIDKQDTYYGEAYNYISAYTEHYRLDEYLTLIEEAKQNVDIPVIASINCFSDNEWISFATRIEQAGADALELNVSLLPVDEEISAEKYEKIYFIIAEKVRSAISVPLALKIGNHSSGLAHLVRKLSWTGNVDSIVLFNRYYSPDIDINNLKVISSNVFSLPSEISTSLRWITLLSDKVRCNLAASTGIHDGEGVIKQILAGADAVQIVSALYKNGPGHISEILNDIERWMVGNKYESIKDFKGKMSLKNTKHPAAFERVQFMKYYSNIE